MPNFKRLDQAIVSCDKYVTSRDIIKSSEKSFHVIQANQTMNESYRNLPNDNYMICSNTYVEQLKNYWAQRDITVDVKIHHTAIIERDEKA